MLAHLGMLVGGVVVADDVDILVSGNALLDESEELQPFLMPVSLFALTNDAPCDDIKRRK